MALKFFNPIEIKILNVLTERVVGSDIYDRWKRSYAYKASTPDYSPTLTTIDRFVAGLPLNLQVQLRQGLRLFQWCPILFIGKLGPFTHLSSRDADTYIRSWAQSRFRLRRRLFRGLRDIILLGYYSQVDANIDHAAAAPRRKDDHPGT